VVDARGFWLDGERDAPRIARPASEEEVAEFGRHAAELRAVAVVKVRNVLDEMGLPERLDLDLHVLGGRELEFEHVLEGAVGSGPLAEPAHRLAGNLLLALETDTRSDGEPEEILGLDLAKIIVLGLRGACHQQAHPGGRAKPDAAYRRPPRH